MTAEEKLREATRLMREVADEYAGNAGSWNGYAKRLRDAAALTGTLASFLSASSRKEKTG
jgi:hypothetical protein